jgi:3-oxoacyl-[acyl-carrier-protein] synthase III
MLKAVITGTGCYIPPVIKKNTAFASNTFYTENHLRVEAPGGEIVEKFRQITGIAERRYAPSHINASDMATHASKIAIAESGIDAEEIDQIIVAHNFGNVNIDSIQSDNCPALASRIKHNLGIRNPHCIPYDILFGCPGWVQGLIQAEIYFKAGVAKKCLVIGTETLSRVLDDHDRDSMLFSDGAGACIVEYKETSEPTTGMLGSNTRSDCRNEAYFIDFGKSNSLQCNQDTRYLKMKGRKVYEYAVTHVPMAMKECLDKSGIQVQDLKKIFIHQANEKMDESIVKAFYNLYGITDVPANIMPMCIHWLGNSSVATVPTLFDLVRKGQLKDHDLQPGDVILFVSVGAGMNINAVCYGY